MELSDADYYANEPICSYKDCRSDQAPFGYWIDSDGRVFYIHKLPDGTRYVEYITNSFRSMMIKECYARMIQRRKGDPNDSYGSY